MADDTLLESHREWIGYVQPVGLLVSPSAMAERGVYPDKNIAPLQRELMDMVETDDDARPVVRDFPAFAKAFLGWTDDDLASAEGALPLPAELSAHLVEYGETLAPTFAVPAPNPDGTDARWQMLIAVEPGGTKLDTDVEDDGHRWVATPHARFERLLRETEIPIGLLVNGHAFRLIHAPKGETSGFATFELSAMTEVAGRPMLAAFHMLLHVNRLFGAPEQCLPALLAESRRHQERVSTQLAEQVLAALHELLRGLSVADARLKQARIVDLGRKDPDHLYAGLLTALMRLVFVLYAEDRDLFPRDPVWEQHYSLAGLFERLRNDAALYPDTMDERFGAWAQLISLWRLIHRGGRHGGMQLVARRGRLFDPDRFPFLEGRDAAADAPEIPPVSDGVVWRILNRLLVLNGERLSYRTLDVEEIGSVYQAVMGFTIELTSGRSIAIRPPKRGGAAATVNLEELLETEAGKRAGWLQALTDRKLTAKQAPPLKAAKSIEELETALDPVIDRAITPTAVPADVPVLQPTETRRRTGSHYTPRALTQPIVTEALRPVLDRQGPDATPAQILDLKVLDPALGSGAFLVEACRQLAERLVDAWARHGGPPPLPPDEDALLHAQRLVAQRCLYGVDRNAMAADLAKLSLWLVTLARDHEFTFLDHAIRHGDALVGLFQDEIIRMDWKPGDNVSFVGRLLQQKLESARTARDRIRQALDDVSEAELRPMLREAENQISDLNLIGDAVVAAFFSADKAKARERARQEVVSVLELGGAGWQEKLKPKADTIRNAEKPLYPFHWELQFPEVFLRENPGFDAIVGNPPYAGKNTIISGNPDHYLHWLQAIHEGAHGNADLVAHFFRHAFRLLRDGGTFGLIATNTIRQGDTRATGLKWIRQHGGTIYSAKRRYKWPGEAAVVVSVLHIAKGGFEGSCLLDGRPVDRITAYLVDQGGDDNPQRLIANAGKSFQGSIVLGLGFTFDDTDKKGIASPVSLMQALIAQDRRNSERIYPYIGGEEVNTDPRHAHHRYVINFENFPLKRDESLPPWVRSSEKQREEMLRRGIVPLDYSDPVAADWPDLLQIIQQKVKPERDIQKRKALRERWWHYAEKRPGLYSTVRRLNRVMVRSQVSKHAAITFISTGHIFDQRLVIFFFDSHAYFSLLQSSVHEIWALTFGSTLEDRATYTPTTCFETFPLPASAVSDTELERLGRQYFDHRDAVMIAYNEGMTITYNRFNDPSDQTPGIVRLRELHSEMDYAVLRAYGWDDLIALAKPVFEPEWIDEDGDGPIRYRWPEEVRDTVIARLLELNAERGREEARLGLTTARRPRVATDEEDEAEFQLERIGE